MSVIPTVWCPYCDSANEMNCKRCWRCRQRIPAQAERTGGAGPAAVPALPAPVAASTGLARVTPAMGAPAAPYMMEIERKQCGYCREWIDPQASVCPYCRTDQGAIAAVQRATWAFMQLFFCFAALGTGVVVLIRLCQWGMTGGVIPGL